MVGFPFHLSLGSPLACSPLSVSAWLVLSPSPVASYSPCVAWGDTPRRVGGVILASRPSSRPLVSLCGPFDFPRIDLRADMVRRFCQLILLRHSLAAGRIVFPFVSSLVSLARLVWASRAYSLRLAHLSVSSHRFVSISAIRFASRVLVSLCGPSPSSRAIRLARRLVKQSVFFRFVRASRLDGSQGGSCSPSRSILFSSYLSVVSHDCWDGGGSSFSSRGGVLSSLLPPVVEFDLAMAVAEMGVPFDDTEGRAVLFSSFSPSRRGMK